MAKKVNEEKKPLTPNEINFGLIAIDKREIVGDEDNPQIRLDKILSFYGFEEQPTCADINLMKKDVKEDKLYEGTDVPEHVVIYDAPKFVIEYFKNGNKA